MDSTGVSEALNSGSIPDKATLILLLLIVFNKTNNSLAMISTKA